MLDLGAIDVEETATALSDRADYGHRWPIGPRTGQVAYRTSDRGLAPRTTVTHARDAGRTETGTRDEET